MRNVSYMSNGQAIEEQDGPLRATQVTRHNTLPPKKCCGCGSRSTLEALGDPHDSQVLVLRIVGIFAVVIGLTEVGLGASLFTYFSNVRSGAWWSVVMVVITGAFAAFANKRHRVTIVVSLSVLGIIIAVIGAIADGRSASDFRDISGCGTRPSDSPDILYYGAGSSFNNVDSCMTAAYFAGTLDFDACYCAPSTTDYFCAVLKLSPASVSMGRNCGSVIKYATAITASFALIIVSLLLVFVMSILGCIALCCPSEDLSLNKQPAKDQPIDINSASSDFGVSSTAFVTAEPEYKNNFA